jgi:hypothetical protein
MQITIIIKGPYPTTWWNNSHDKQINQQHNCLHLFHNNHQDQCSLIKDQRWIYFNEMLWISNKHQEMETMCFSSEVKVKRFTMTFWLYLIDLDSYQEVHRKKILKLAYKLWVHTKTTIATTTKQTIRASSRRFYLYQPDKSSMQFL